MKVKCQSGSLEVGRVEGSQWRARAQSGASASPLYSGGCRSCYSCWSGCPGQLRTAPNLTPPSSSLIVMDFIRASKWGQVSEGNKQCKTNICNRTRLPDTPSPTREQYPLFLLLPFLDWFLGGVFCFAFETESHYIALDGLEFIAFVSPVLELKLSATMPGKG